MYLEVQAHDGLDEIVVGCGDLTLEVPGDPHFVYEVSLMDIVVPRTLGLRTFEDSPIFAPKTVGPREEEVKKKDPRHPTRVRFGKIPKKS